MARDVSHLIRNTLAGRLRNNFNINNVPGLTAIPPIVQNIDNTIDEAYVHIYSELNERIDATKDDSSVDYTTIFEIRDTYPTGTGGPRVRDLITDEVVDLLDRWIPTITNTCVYVSVVTSVSKNRLDFNNRTFFISQIEIITRAVSGSTVAPSDLPVQSPLFAFNGFTFAPSSNRIELYDVGTITPSTTYPNGNNGFDFVSAAYTLAPGSDGVLNNGIVTVDGDDVVSINSELDYVNDSNTEDTRQLTSTTTFPRIKSLRSGSISPAIAEQQPIFTNDSAALFGLQNLSNWSIDFGNVAPHGTTVTISGDAGDYGYIILDSSDTILTLRDQLNTENVGNFTLTTIGGFNIYIRREPFYYDGTSIQLTINTQ